MFKQQLQRKNNHSKSTYSARILAENQKDYNKKCIKSQRNNMGKNTDSNKVLLSVHFPCVHLVLDAAGYGGEGGELVGRHLAVHPSQVGQQGRLTHGWEA
jgi:hypothetical protein